MPTTLIDTCPLCGLRFGNRRLLELHLREDHVQAREHHADSPETADQATRPPRDHPESSTPAE